MSLPCHIINHILLLVPQRVVVLDVDFKMMTFNSSYSACLFMVKHFNDLYYSCPKSVAYSMSICEVDQRIITQRQTSLYCLRETEHKAWAELAAENVVSETLPSYFQSLAHEFPKSGPQNLPPFYCLWRYKYPRSSVYGVFSTSHLAIEAALSHCLRDPAFVCQLFYPRIGLEDKTNWDCIRYQVTCDDKRKELKFDVVFQNVIAEHGYDEFKRLVHEWSCSTSLDTRFLTLLKSKHV